MLTKRVARRGTIICALLALAVLPIALCSGTFGQTRQQSVEDALAHRGEMTANTPKAVADMARGLKDQLPKHSGIEIGYQQSNGIWVGLSQPPVAVPDMSMSSSVDSQVYPWSAGLLPYLNARHFNDQEHERVQLVLRGMENTRLPRWVFIKFYVGHYGVLEPSPLPGIVMYLPDGVLGNQHFTAFDMVYDLTNFGWGRGEARVTITDNNLTVLQQNRCIFYSGYASRQEAVGIPALYTADGSNGFLLLKGANLADATIVLRRGDGGVYVNRYSGDSGHDLLVSLPVGGSDLEEERIGVIAVVGNMVVADLKLGRYSSR